MDIEFNSVTDLYKRIKPALVTKREDMRRRGYDYITEEDIWNYLREVKWEQSKDLSLYQMVSDILNTNDVAIDTYLKQKLNTQNRKLYFEEPNQGGNI